MVLVYGFRAIGTLIALVAYLQEDFWYSQISKVFVTQMAAMGLV
jgi:hypothetical protein